ncbi:aspartate/glutamate racemase family protein (plasmid) [Ensifer adhaerens]|uniref:aspartate/glutamate racemase family protein n=1 Tax=Ensifer adhaerens TaxID=106592 RepID=UPI000DE3A3D1
MKRRVGILGGMGPEATILVMQKVLAAVDADDDADHVPLIVDQNPQVPSRIKHLIEGTGSDPAPVLADMALRLAAGGAEAVAMPCNTAHHYSTAIRAAVEVPFLDMIELSADRAAQLTGAGGRLGILASPAVQKVGLFDGPLTKRGLTPVFPDSEAAGRMLSAIRLIKAEGPCSAARDVLRAVSAELASRGAAVQMIACTEFSLIADAVAESATVFDTLDCLVEAIVHFSGARPASARRDAT